MRIESRWGLPEKPKSESLNSGFTMCRYEEMVRRFILTPVTNNIEN